MFQAYKVKDIDTWNIKGCACRDINSEQIKSLSKKIYTYSRNLSSVKFGAFLTVSAMVATIISFSFFGFFYNEVLSTMQKFITFAAILGMLTVPHMIQRYKFLKENIKAIRSEILNEHDAYIIWMSNERMILGFKLPEV